MHDFIGSRFMSTLYLLPRLDNFNTGFLVPAVTMCVCIPSAPRLHRMAHCSLISLIELSCSATPLIYLL